MRGPSAEERRSGQLQRLAQLGLIADDACLSTFNYPALAPADERSLQRLVEWLTPSAPAMPASRIERSNALHDAADLMTQVVELTGRAQPQGMPVRTPSAIIDPLSRMLKRSASQQDVLVVRAFAETLSRLTLMLTEQLANEKDSQDWTTTPLTFSGVQ